MPHNSCGSVSYGLHLEGIWKENILFYETALEYFEPTKYTQQSPLSSSYCQCCNVTALYRVILDRVIAKYFRYFQRFIDAHPGIPILDNLTHIVPLHDRTSMFQQLQKFESVKNGKTKWDSISLELTAVYLCHPISHICQGFLTNSLALG